MDLTPQVINEVEFSMARRGYDPDQVDEFLEKVAVAVGELSDRLGELRERVTSAERRAEEAERRAAEQPERVVVTAAPAPSAAAVSAAAEAELETLKRTLLLAQRTADAAVREAEEEAARMIAAAEDEARAMHEATRRGVLQEISTLETTRDSLRVDADALDRHVEVQRARLEGTIADLQRILVEPARLSASPLVEPSPPTVEPSDVAEPAEEELVAGPVVDEVVEEAESEAAAVEAEPEVGAAPPQSAGRFVLADERDDDEAWAHFGADDDVVEDGPRTEPVLRLDRVEEGEGEGDDDAYLTELRKAMLDDTGAPDADDLGYFDEADAGRAARTRFGRRR